MADIYYTDTLGSNLNVFEKKTKSGEPFYYIYLNKNLIDDSEVENLVKLIEGSIINKPKVKQKKGKLAYQIAWSYKNPTPLNEQQILFDVMFKRLKNLGYVDTYQAKSGRSKKTTTTSSTPTSTIKHIVIPSKKLEVGDELYFMANKWIKKNISPNLFKIDSFGIVNGKSTLNISWVNENGEYKTLEGWLTLDDAQAYVQDGTISFPEGATTSAMPQVDLDFSNTTPVQVGDEFILVQNPNNITKNERDRVRTIKSIDLVKQDANYVDANDIYFSITFSELRTYIDNGNLIFINRPSLNPSNTQGAITSLSYYDLIKRVGDGKLFRVLNADGVGYDKNDKFNNIPDDALIDLEYYDPTARDFQMQQIRFIDLKKNFEKGELEYLGQVREGDVFNNNDDFLQRVVTQVDDYPHDVNFTIYELNTNPAKKLNDDVLVMNVFTRSVLRRDKLVARNSGNATTTPTTTSTTTTQQVSSKPKINSDEIDALKKEIADLLFLKNGISDLDFEEKINISTEIQETQRKIDDLNEKLFEERVGDENFFDKLFEQSFTPLKDRYDMDIVKNTIPEIISPSGEMSDLDESMQVLVNSNEFKDWFGDWRNAYFYRNIDNFGGLNISKVMNDKFEPQLVWHGTNNEFSYFDFETFPANYFAVNKEYSEFFAINKGGRGYVLPFILNIKNPLDLSDFGIKNVSSKDFFDWMFLMTGMTPEELEINPLFLDPTLKPNPIWVYIRNNPTMLKKIAQGNVYDGIKFYEFNPNADPNDKLAYETLAYIIFDPHQAKLADPNRGEILLSSLKSFMLKRGGKI